MSDNSQDRDRWNELAELLGLPPDAEPQPKPVPAKPKSVAVSPPPAPIEPDFEDDDIDEVNEVPPAPAFAEKKHHVASGHSFAIEENDLIEEITIIGGEEGDLPAPLPFVSEAESADPEPEAGSEAEGEATEGGPTKKRRRRGRRGRRGDAVEAKNPDAAPVAGATEEVTEAAESAEDTSEPCGVGDESTEEGPGRGRRRRRRRGGRRGEGEEPRTDEAPVAAIEAEPVEAFAPPADSELDEEVIPQRFEDNDEDVEDMSSWNVPAWQDLIAALYRP